MRLLWVLVLVASVFGDDAEYTLKLLITTTQALTDRVQATVVNNPLETGPLDEDGNLINDGWAPITIADYVEVLMQEVNYLYRTVSTIKINVIMTHFVANVDDQWDSLPDAKGECGTALADWKLEQTTPGMAYGVDFDAVLLLVDALSEECGLGSGGGGWASEGLAACNDDQFSVVADIGYGSASIIAHELGHNLGLGHIDDSGEVIMQSDPGSHWSEASMDELALNIPLITTSGGEMCMNDCVELDVAEYKSFTRNEVCNFRYPFDNNAKVCDDPCGDDDLPFPRCGTSSAMADCSQIKCNKKNLDPDNMGGGYCKIDASPHLDRTECTPDGGEANTHRCYQGACTPTEDVPTMVPYTCLASVSTHTSQTTSSNSPDSNQGDSQTPTSEQSGHETTITEPEGTLGVGSGEEASSGVGSDGSEDTISMVLIIIVTVVVPLALAVVLVCLKSHNKLCFAQQAPSPLEEESEAFGNHTKALFHTNPSSQSSTRV